MNGKWVGMAGMLAICLAMPAFSLDRSEAQAADAELAEFMRSRDERTLQADLSRIEGKLREASPPAEKIGAGIVFHDASRTLFPAGVRGYAQKSYNLLKTLYDDRSLPERYRPLVTAYLGSARTLMGNEDNNPFNKMSYVKQGLKYLDEAVSKYREATPIVSFVRASVCVNLPEFFNTLDKARGDLRYLEDRAQGDPAYLEASLLSEVLLELGNIAKKDKKMSQALAYWRRAVEVDPSGQAAGQAKEKLSVYGG